jgi:hypothetical protein
MKLALMQSLLMELIISYLNPFVPCHFTCNIILFGLQIMLINTIFDNVGEVIGTILTLVPMESN